MIGNGPPEDVFVILPDGTRIPCTMTYQGTSVGDDGKLMHDWLATPDQALPRPTPGDQFRLDVGTLPGRTGIEFGMRGSVDG